MSELRITPLEMKWLERQTKPVWGAHIDRGEPVQETMLWPLVQAGIIERWDTERDKGYRISEKAKTAMQLEGVNQ